MSSRRPVNPVIQSYVYPGDKKSQKRFWLFYFFITGVLMFVGGPILEIFLVQPLISLLLQEAATITPDTGCFNHRLMNQTCSDDVIVEYYFWNMTNAAAWLAGGEPPAYQELGPYAFASKEVRYNLSYTEAWDAVEYTYHQYAEFLPDKSCVACRLNDTFTSVNRAYLQFIAAGEGAPPGTPDSETMVMSTLLPSSLRLSLDTISAFMGPLSGSTDSETIYNYTLSQWSACGPVDTVKDLYGLPSPFVKDSGVAALAYHPEFCQFVVETLQNMYGANVEPSQFPLYGIGLSLDASRAFIELAVGASNMTHQDPLSQQFLYMFLMYDQSTVLQHLAASSAPQAPILGAIDANTWALLQGYVLRTMTEGGKVLFDAALVAGNGGLVVQRPLEEWLYGFEDPLLRLGAVAADPTSFHLRPWEYTPSLALTFASAAEPLEYFGLESYGQLSWNRSEVGRFLPLIQQKRMQTGKAAHHFPHAIDAYRGLGFRNESWGILNMTGQNEGISVGVMAQRSTPFLTFDSALSRAVLTEYSGHDIQVKKIDSMLFTISNSSLAACNWTAYEDWADRANFDYASYRSAINGLSEAEFWTYMSNDTLLADTYNLSAYFSDIDVSRDRCMVPDQLQAAWDVSGTFACPSIYSLPRFLGADAWSRSTGVPYWNASLASHAYGLAVEPLTGISVKGHKTYQLNHVVSRTPIVYPNVWVVNGSDSSENSGMSAGNSITVPIYWVRMSWEPTDADAYLLRAMKTLITYMYTILVIFWPSIGSVFAISSILLLLLGKEAQERKKALAALSTYRGKDLVFRSCSKARRRIHVRADATALVVGTTDPVSNSAPKTIDLDVRDSSRLSPPSSPIFEPDIEGGSSGSHVGTVAGGPSIPARVNNMNATCDSTDVRPTEVDGSRSSISYIQDAVGLEDASDEEEFIRSAHLVIP